MGLGNPVPGHIQANGENWDRQGFIVTATFQQHIDSGRAAGIDLGNGQGWGNSGGAPVLAMDDGQVTMAGALGVANVVRIRHPNGYTSGYAHLATITVARLTDFTRGQQIGTVGMTGADAPHLHGGYTDPQGREQDWWPLLTQNQEEESMRLAGTKGTGTTLGTFTFGPVAHALISPIDLEVQYPTAPGDGPYAVLAIVDLVTPDGKPMDIGGTSPPLNNRDQVYLVDGPRFGAAAYALRQDGTFTPAVAPGPVPPIPEPPVPPTGDVTLALAELTKQTVALNDASRAITRARTHKNNAKAALT